MTDHQAHAVAELVNRHGMDQLEASRLVYSGKPPRSGPEAAWSLWVRMHVRQVFAPLRERVGLR